MKPKRILSLFLALLLTAGSLAACADTPDGPAETDGVTTEAVFEEETFLKDDLPDDLDLGGTTVTFYGLSGTRIGASELAVTGDHVNDAIFERNKYVEDRLNVEISVTEENTLDDFFIVNKVATLVQSGSTEYDVVTSACWVLLDQVLSGYYANLAATEYMDLTQPWWTQDFNESTSYHGLQFAAAGHILLSTYSSAYATTFNQNLFTEANQPFLYEYVENGTWTLDKQASLAPLFHRDNGNGVQDANGDYYGLVSALPSYVDCYWASCEVDMIRKNEDGDFELVLDTERLYEVAEKVLYLFYQTEDATYLEPNYDVAGMFAKGTSAMATIFLGAMEQAAMRNMEDIYGVVPIPRLTEDQKDYRSSLAHGFNVLALPTTIKGDRLDSVSAVLEAMASASYNIVRPVYYETTLRTKLANDPKSSVMIDLIINNLRTDAGYLYDKTFNQIYSGLREVTGKKQNTIISTYTSRAKTYEKTIRNVNDKMARLAAKYQ